MMKPIHHGNRATAFVRAASSTITVSARASDHLGSPSHVTVSMDGRRVRIAPCLPSELHARVFKPSRGAATRQVACLPLVRIMPSGRVPVSLVDGGLEFTL